MEILHYRNSQRSSLKIAVPQFSKYKERLLIILVKSLNFYYTLLVTKKSLHILLL